MPRAKVATKLAQLLDCRVEWLMEGVGEIGRFSVYARPEIEELERISKLPDAAQDCEFKRLRKKAREKFPVRLRWLREQSGLGMNEFARRVGYAPSYISRLENGSRKNPSMKFLEELTAHFGVNRMWLLYGEKPLQYRASKDSSASFIHVVKSLDIDFLDKLETIDRKEQRAAGMELIKVLDALSKVLDAKSMASLIESLDAEKLDSVGIDFVIEGLKDSLVKKVAKGENGKNSS